MGASMLVAKFIGKALGGALHVPVKDGIMLPYVYKYAEKLADLAKETNRVSESFLRELAEQAHRRQDFEALKTIYEYAKRFDYSGGLIRKLIEYGQQAKIFHHIGDPFALLDSIESVVRSIC